MRSLLNRLRRLSAAPTQRLLLTHLFALLALTAISTCALLVSYHVVHRTPEEMRDRMAPAVQEVAATRAALLRAQAAAAVTAGDEELTEVVGAGEEYRTQVSAADQSLSRVAERQLAGDDGRSTLEAVNGLLTVYADAVGQATGKYAHNGLMRQQKLKEAESILRRAGTGIVPRLDGLQKKQVSATHARASFGTAQTTGWVVAELSLLLLAVVLGSAWWTLRRRCGRMFNGWLLAALLLTVLLAALPLWWTVGTQRQLDTAREQLAATQGDANRQQITDAADSVRAAMDSTDPSAARAPGIAAGCGALLLLPLLGLGWRLYADYERAAP